MRAPGGRLRWAAASVSAVALLLGGCTSSEDPAPSPTSDPSGSASGGEQVPLRSAVGTVSGRLKPKLSEQAATRVGTAVDRWFQAAYLSGDYPRGDFGTAFPGFTDGASKDARKDRTLLTNASIGGDVETVTADLRQVKVDLLAADQKPVGATARFRLVFTTTGTYAKEVTVQGRMFLTANRAGAWHIFGYDVTRASK